MDVFECVVLNHETKRTANIRLEPSQAPLTKLMEGIVEKENTAFFKGELLESDKALYNTLTTGEPLDEMYIKVMNIKGNKNANQPNSTNSISNCKSIFSKTKRG